MKDLWSGRFDKPLDPRIRAFTSSLDLDRRIAAHDVRGSIAHARMLGRQKIVSADESAALVRELEKILAELASGTFAWPPGAEDVHSAVEQVLQERAGAVAGKLHTARSRNDQVALDLRLYVKAEIAELSAGLRSLQTALLNLSEQHVDVVMPGYTHLQRAQPIFLAHYLLAQIEAFERDAERLRDCNARTDVLPLGSGALAGSTIVLDRELVARELGFSRVSQNSLDAVGDRDFVCEFLFCLAMIGMHLSRLSEDLITWSTHEFGFVEFSDAFSTGSSLMPQKKNPDMAELTRGKTGRLYGNLLSILTTLKALRSSYNRDMQEDKEALFDSVDTVRAALEVFSAMLPKIEINRGRMEAAASDPNLLATDLAEYLVKKGTPFREAHEIVGKLVAHAAKTKSPLNQIPIAELKKASPLFDIDVANVFDVRRSLAARTAIGAPAPGNVAAQIARWHKLLD